MKLTFFILLFTPCYLEGQITISDFSEAKIVRDHIILTLNSDSLIYYNIDDSPLSRYNILENNQLFQAKSGDFHIRMKYVNPLHYQVSSTSRSVDDELFKDTDKYISNAISFIGTMSGRIDPNNASVENPADLKFKTSESEILDIYVRLRTNVGGVIAIEITQDLLNALMAIKVDETFKVSMDSLKKNFRRLYSITQFSEVMPVLNINESNILTIDKKLSAVNDSILAFEKMVLKIVQGNEDNLNFQWVQIGVLNLKTKLTEAKKQIQEVKDKYEKTKNLFKSANVTNEELFISDLKISREKSFYEIDISVKKLDFDLEKLTLSEKTEKTYTIRVHKFQRFIPSVSTGAILSGLKFKTFGTGMNALGETIVTEVEEELDPLNFGAYLNIHINNPSDLTPLIQFGVSTTKNKPALMLGLGASFRDITLSAGSLWTWVPKLDNLSVGQVVSGTAQIEENIKYGFQEKPFFYIGLSFNIIKKNN